MDKHLVAFALLGSLALLLPATALAGAWTAKRGEGQVIVSGLYSEAFDAFDEGGNPYAIPLFRKVEIGGYAEYGLTDWLTAIMRTDLKSEAAGTPLALDEARFGLSGLGARARLWEGGSAVVSAELSGRLPTGHSGGRWEGDPDAEIDLRLLAGYGFTLGSWSGFVDLQGAYRIRPGAPNDEVRADLTLGLRPRPRLLWMAQSFNTIAAGGGAFAGATEHKAQVSLVYDLTKHLSVQFGGIATVAGRNALSERGVISAVWYRF